MSVFLTAFAFELVFERLYRCLYLILLCAVEKEESERVYVRVHVCVTVSVRLLKHASETVPVIAVVVFVAVCESANLVGCECVVYLQMDAKELVRMQTQVSVFVLSVFVVLRGLFAHIHRVCMLLQRVLRTDFVCMCSVLVVRTHACVVSVKKTEETELMAVGASVCVFAFAFVVDVVAVVVDVVVQKTTELPVLRFAF